MNFSEILAEKMKERAETKYRLAKELEVHQTSVAKWLNGTKPQLAHLDKLAKHYGMTREQMLGEDR